MAKNITLMGASYSDVPAVVLPQTGGGTARFDDASVTTATASDVAEGKVFLSADGTITTGSSSGGGGIQRIVIRPDAELWQSWTYDKYIVADEGVAIPAYTTSAQTLKASEQLAEITADVEHYRYFTALRTLAYPEYSTSNTGRGRFEWSSMVGAYEFIFTPMAELHPLVPGDYRIATNSAAVQGGVSYRGLYFSSVDGLSIYATSTYGIWTPNAAPAYVGGKMRVNSPSFIMRGQPNILDQPFWEAITDIRFQYVIELWRVPLGSLQYDGWSNMQSVDLTLDCLYSNDHKLT